MCEVCELQKQINLLLFPQGNVQVPYLFVILEMQTYICKNLLIMGESVPKCRIRVASLSSSFVPVNWTSPKFTSHFASSEYHNILQTELDSNLLLMLLLMLLMLPVLTNEAKEELLLFFCLEDFV